MASRSIFTTLAKEASRSEAYPFVFGLLGAFVLLPKFAYGEEELKKSYWIKQYSPEVLGVEDSGAHGSAAPTKEDLVLREALDKINRIEEHLGIPKQ